MSVNMRCPERTSLDRIKITQWSVLSLKPSVADGVIISALYLTALNHFCLFLSYIQHMHNVIKTRLCILASRNALSSLRRVSKPKNTACVMDIQPEKLGLGRTSCLSYHLLSASLPTTKHTVFLIAKVKDVCHLVVRKLWNVEDQQVWCYFVLVACFTYDPNSPSSLESHWIFQIYFFPARLECCIMYFFFQFRKIKKLKHCRYVKCFIAISCQNQLSSGVAIKITLRKPSIWLLLLLICAYEGKWF